MRFPKALILGRLRLPCPRGSRRCALLAALTLSCASSPLRVTPEAPPRAVPVAAVASKPPASPAPEEVLDEDESLETPELSAGEERVHPLDGWSEAKIRETLQADPPALGSMSLGQPSAGSLMNAVRAEDSPLFKVHSAEGAYGTAETIDYLSAAIRAVHERFPETPPLALGHISARNGGPLRPHLSHQAGRDVDISFYYRDGSGWYARGTRENLDLERTWAFVRALVIETDVEMILIDQSIQNLLERYALELGEDPTWIRGLFHGGADGLRRVIRHAPGHATHLHIRFYNPIAQETARRVSPLLYELGLRKPAPSFVRHRARPGDTLGKLAKRYGTTVVAIKHANGLKSNRIRERRDYRIPVAPKKTGPSQAQNVGHALNGQPLRFPPRRLPPTTNKRPSTGTAPRVSSR